MEWKERKSLLNVVLIRRLTFLKFKLMFIGARIRLRLKNRFDDEGRTVSVHSLRGKRRLALPSFPAEFELTDIAHTELTSIKDKIL